MASSCFIFLFLWIPDVPNLFEAHRCFIVSASKQLSPGMASISWQLPWLSGYPKWSRSRNPHGWTIRLSRFPTEIYLVYQVSDMNTFFGVSLKLLVIWGSPPQFLRRTWCNLNFFEWFSTLRLFGKMMIQIDEILLKVDPPPTRSEKSPRSHPVPIFVESPVSKTQLLILRRLETVRIPLRIFLRCFKDI